MDDSYKTVLGVLQDWADEAKEESRYVHLGLWGDHLFV